MVGTFNVHRPWIVLFANNVSRRNHRCKHRVVLVVVVMHTVTTDGLEILQRFYSIAKRLNALKVTIVIHRVYLRLANDCAVNHAFSGCKSGFGEFASCQLKQVLI